MEHIRPYIRPPWWKLPSTTEISPECKDKAAEAHQQRLRQISTEDLIIYTDGSGHNRHIGAAIYSPTTEAIKGEYIGTDDTHNVYAAELTGIQMGVTLFKETKDEYKNVYVFTDNRSAIQAIDTPKYQSGQYIIKKTLDTIDKIHELARTCNMHFKWVLGHKNLEGNEQAYKHQRRQLLQALHLRTQ
jgi:ribonuclease HI